MKEKGYFKNIRFLIKFLFLLLFKFLNFQTFRKGWDDFLYCFIYNLELLVIICEFIVVVAIGKFAGLTTL